MSKEIQIFEYGRRISPSFSFLGTTKDWDFEETVLVLPPGGAPDTFQVNYNDWFMLVEDREADRFLGTGDFAT